MPDETKSHRNIVRGAALTLREAAGLQKQGTHRPSKATLRDLTSLHRLPGRLIGLLGARICF